jgi:hypothetical protein
MQATSVSSAVADERIVPPELGRFLAILRTSLRTIALTRVRRTTARRRTAVKSQDVVSQRVILAPI